LAVFDNRSTRHHIRETVSMAQLSPVSSFPALFPKYIAEQEETLVFRGRQYGSSYDISTIDGRKLFAVDPLPSLGRRTQVMDMQGKNIFGTRKETFHLGSSRYFIERPSRSNDTKLLTIEFKMFKIGTKFTVTFDDGIAEQQGQLHFDRGYFSSDGTVTKGVDGPVVAHVERQITLLRKEYKVIVAKGMDMALISGLIVCLDDQEKSHKNAPSLGGGRWG
jgi:uncharacterized protein YxjI